MATQENTSKAIGEIAVTIDRLAAQLAGIRPITRLVCDGCDTGTDAGNAIEAIGALADYINSSLNDVSNSLNRLAKEGGAA